MRGLLRAARRRLTFSNVTAGCALFIALGGTSYAALTLPRNSVGSGQLRKGAVTSAKVRDRSLTAADFKPGTLRAGERGAAGERGRAAPQGPKRDTGPVGPAGSTGPRGPSFGGAITRASGQLRPASSRK
jgi:hypothetical protein